MAARRAASKKPAAPVEERATEPAPTTEMGGEHYQKGYLGVSQDDADYSIAAEVARLSEDR